MVRKTKRLAKKSIRKRTTSRKTSVIKRTVKKTAKIKSKPQAISRSQSEIHSSMGKLEKQSKGEKLD